MTPTEALGLTIRQLRKARGKSQEQLAHEAGLSLTSMARIELGQQEVRFGTLLRLASALQLDGDELVAEVEQMLSKAPKATRRQPVKRK